MKLLKKYMLDEYEYIFNFIKITDQYMLGEFDEEYVREEVMGRRDDYVLIEVYYFIHNNELIEVIVNRNTGETITERDIPSTISHLYYRNYGDVLGEFEKWGIFRKV